MEKLSCALRLTNTTNPINSIENFTCLVGTFINSHEFQNCKCYVTVRQSQKVVGERFALSVVQSTTGTGKPRKFTSQEKDRDFYQTGKVGEFYPKY